MGRLTDSYNKYKRQQGENSAAGSNTSTGDEEKKVTVIGKVGETEENSGPKNVGGFGGGLEYLGTKFVDGLVSNVEGIVDFVAGGIAEMRGDDDKAQEIFQNDWYNYNRADEKYNPGTGWKVAGDLSGVLGGAAPDIGAGLILAAAGAPAVVAALIGAGLSFTSGSGRGINEAVNKTGELGQKEWAGGMGSGALAAGIELISGGIGAAAGGTFGKATTEIGMEIGESLSKKASSKAIGGALGEIAEEGSEATAKNIIKKIFTSKAGKELAGEMISEGIEESIETFLEPAIKQNTYDPDAPNASVSDVGYSFLLGAAAGGLIKGGQLGIESTVNTVRGGKISADSTKMNNLMHNAQAVSSYESEKQTGSEVFQAVTNLYNDIQQRLAASGGKPTMATMEKIGELDRMVTTAVLVPSMVNAAKGIAQNAQSTVDALNNFYKKTGQNSITVEQLTAGLVMDKGSKAFVRSVEKAMKENGLLRSVVINNMLGRMEFDAQSFANSIYGDIDISSIATQQNLNRFLSTADAATINQLGAALGISNWAAVTPEELKARIEAFRDSGQAELHRGGYEAIEKAKRAKGYTNGMPESVSSLAQGATRFKTDKADFAIIREGDKFRLYDFETGHVTNAMSLGDMEAIVARLKQRAAEIDAESEMAALDRELNDFANENVPEYKKLTEAEKEAVRATLRSARANGISVKDQILFARIAAKSGLNIIVELNLKGDNPARYDGRNTVYINASAPRTRLYTGLLGHEVFHKMFKSAKIKRLFMQAWNNLDEAKRDSVTKQYMAEEQKRKNYDSARKASAEEVAAAYAEEIFNNPGVWDYILSEEPSLKDRVIAFFKGAPKRYSFAPEMDAAAKKWIQQYKKLFDQVAARNAGMNVVEDVTTVERKEQIKKIGKLVDELGGTATQVPKKVIKKIGKIVPEESAEGTPSTASGPPPSRGRLGAEINKKTASGTKVQDSGERFAINEDFEESLNRWDRKTIGFSFVVGETSNALQEAGIPKRQIRWDASKIATLLNKHKGMSIDVIKQIPQLLEFPVIVIDSKKGPNAKIVMGDLYDSNNKVVTAVLLLTPTSKKGNVLELIKISSAEGRGHIKSLFTYDDGTSVPVRYVDKKRIQSWLNVNRLQLPLHNLDSDSINIISQNAENSNTSDKNTSKDFDSGERSALADGKSEKLTEAEQEMLDNPWVGRVEREAIVEALIKEAKIPEELDTIDSYIRESDILVEKLGERASALRDIKAEKKKISDLFSGAESKDARKKVMQSKQYKEAKRRIIMLEDKVSLIEDEISRRDAELFRLSSIKPLHDMLMRAYQIGKEEGATARVSQGLVNKRVAAVLNAKFFTLKDAQAIINDIVSKYPVDDYNVRSELARRLWTQLNATEDLKDQKQALKGIANDVVRAVYAKKTNDMKIESAIVKRAGKYQGRIAFTEEERSHLIKYYGEEAENILSIWEYKGDPKTEPKALKDVLWDVGQIKPYERFAAQENSSPAFRSDAFYDLVDAYEIADEKIAPLRKESTSVRNEILDSLIRGFMDGGRETYKAKYDSLNDTVNLRNRIEQHAKNFKSLVKGEFANSTRNEDHLFVNTLDQIPKIMYRGTLYDGRARNVAKGLAAWYTPDNPMLGDGTNPDETLYKQEIADMLKNLSDGDSQRRLSTDELEMLDDVLKYFHSFVEHYTKVFRNKKWVDALPIAEGFMSVARAHENRVRGWSENIFANRYVKTFGDAESIMKICDGYGNGIFTDTYNNIREGYIDAKVQEMHILQEYTEFTEKNSKYIKNIDKDTVEYRGQSVPKAAMIGYYLSLARHHLVAGAAFSGFVYDRPKGKGKQVIRGYLADVDPKTVDNEGLLRSAETERNNIKKLLSEKDLEYISMIEKIYEVCGDVKYEADMAMYGYSNVVKNGGRYYPGRRYAAGQKGAGLDVYSEMGTMDRFTNASFNKNTVKGARQALYIENPDTLLRRHVSALCLYANLSPTIDNFNRLWRLDVESNANLPTSLQTMMDESENIWRIDGKIVGYEYLKDLIADIMGVTNKKGSKILGLFRKNYATFALGGLIGANPKVILTQFSSLISSTSILKGSSLIKSGTIKGDDVDKYCPLAELRNNEESAVKSQGVIDEIGIIGEKATALISKTDRLVIKRLFAACQVEVASDDLPIGSERNKKAAGELLHSIILKTQQNALVTERTESMRSGSEFIKMLSMFRADSVKNTARVIDAIGEAIYIKRQLGSLDNDSKTVMNEKLKEVNKKVYKATASLLMNSAFAVIIAQAMNTLYAKEKEEDERSAWAEWLIDFGGNMLGGLPVFSQVYSSLIEGYDFEGFEYAMINDLLDAAKAVDNTIDKAWEEKATSDDIMYGTKKLIDAAGQMFGIPTRNVRNTIFGLIKRFDSSTRYRIDDAYGKKNYVSDFADAIEKGDDRLATVIMELGFGDKMGSGLSDKAIGELVRLGKTGEKVIPSGVSDKITVDGEEIDLSGKEIRAVREKYGEAVDMVNMIVESEIYDSFDDEAKADAVNKIYTLYKNLAYDSVIGSKKDEEAYILSKIVDGDILCLNELAYMQPSDKEENGNTISGSKRGKVVAAINGLDISEEKKLLLIATHGYGLKDGDVGGMNKTRADRVLFNYIASLGLDEEEMLKLYEYAGYDVENGKASGSIASGGSNSGSSTIPTLGGSRSGRGGLGGNGRLGGLGGSTRLGSRATLGSTTRNRVKRLGKLV